MRALAILLLLAVCGCAAPIPKTSLETLVYPDDADRWQEAPRERWAEPGDLVWLRVWQTRPTELRSWTEDTIRMLGVEDGRAKFLVRRRQAQPELRTPDSFVAEGQTTAQAVFSGGVGYLRLPEAAPGDVELTVTRIEGQRVFYRLQRRAFPCKNPLGCVEE
jgi:hypothetical protein